MQCRSLGGAVVIGVAIAALAATVGDRGQRAAAAEPRELAYISSTGSVGVFDTSTNELITRIGSPEQVVALPGGEQLLRTGLLDSIEVLDTSTLKVAATVLALEQFSRGGIFGVDADTAYVLSSNGIQVLDLGALKVSLLRITEPDFLALSPGVERAYAVTSSGGGIEVTAIDTSTTSVVDSATIPVGSIRAVALSPSGSRLYLLDVSRGLIIVLGASLSAVQVPIETDRGPREIVLSSDGTSAYVAYRDDHLSVIDLIGGTMIDQITLPHPIGKMAVTSDGRSLYALHPGDCSASVVDLSTRTVMTTFDVGEQPEAIDIVPAPPANPAAQPSTTAVRPRTENMQECAYVTHSDAITVIDIGTRAARGTFPFSKPRRVALSPDGSRAYVTHRTNREATGAIAVLDTARNEILDEIVVGTVPQAIVLADGGATGFVTQLEAPCSTLLSFDTSTKKLRRRDECAACSSPTRGDFLFALDVAISADGKAYVVMTGDDDGDTISVVDLATGEMAASIPLPRPPERAVLAPDGRALYVIMRGSLGVIDTSTNTLAKVVNLMQGSTRAIEVSPDGRFLYVGYSEGSSSPKGIAVVDTDTNEVTASVPLESSEFISGIALAPDGSLAYVSGTEFVSIVDTSAHAVVATVPVPGQTEDIAIGLVPGGCTGAPVVCKGDCDGNGEITIDELLVGVHRVLGTNTFFRCPAFDSEEEAPFQIDDLVSAVNNAVIGCRASEP